MSLAERCLLAGQPLDRLQEEFLNDLDATRGGFSWWYGYTDQPRIVLASDYLYAVAATVSKSLRQAAFHELQFTNNWTAKSNRLMLAGSQPTAEDLARVLQRDGAKDEDRDTALDAHCDGFFVSVGSALDQMAALVIGVAALKMPLVKANWGKLRQLPQDPAVSDKRMDEPGTPGRSAQAAVLQTVDRLLGEHTDGWLDWTVASRNTLVHRADRMRMEFFYRPDKASVLRLVHLLPRHPDCTDAEALVRGRRRRSDDSPTQLFVPEHAGDVMTGLLNCTLALIGGLTEQLIELWTQRRGDPRLLVQPGKQWSQLWQGKLSPFAGFGAKSLPLPDDHLRVSPSTARRLTSAKIFDADRDFWDKLDREADERS